MLETVGVLLNHSWFNDVSSLELCQEEMLSPQIYSSVVGQQRKKMLKFGPALRRASQSLYFRGCHVRSNCCRDYRGSNEHALMACGPRSREIDKSAAMHHFTYSERRRSGCYTRSPRNLSTGRQEVVRKTSADDPLA